MTDARDRYTPTPFSRAEVEQIRRMIANRDEKISCPACNEELTSGLPVVTGGKMEPVWEMSCPSCRRSLIVTNLPAQDSTA